MDAIDILSNKLESWGEAAIAQLPNLAVATLVFALFWTASRWVSRVLCKPLERVSQSQQVNDLAISFARAALISVGFFIALRILELGGAVTSLLAGVGILGLALGFAFQDIAANFVSGILMAFRRPFEVGDIVKTNGYLGTITDVDLRSTRLETFEGQLVTIPNKDVFGNPIENFNRLGKRRVDVQVGCSYGDDLEKAEKTALSAVAEFNDLDRGPELYYEAFGDSSINFRLRLWIDPNQRNFLQTRHDAIKAVKVAFDREGISIPFPIRTLDFGIEGGVPLREALPQGLRNGDSSEHRSSN